MPESEVIKPINIALDEADDIVSYLKRMTSIEKIAIVSDLRRRCELISQIVIVVYCDNKYEVVETLDACSLIELIVDYNLDSFKALTKQGLDLRIRFSSKDYFEYEKFIFTAAPKFLENFMDDNLIEAIDCCGLDETAIFALADLPYLPATIREDYSEVLRFRGQKKIDLVCISDIKGDLHVHSNYSDGRNCIELLATRADEMSYSYLGISDHSQSLTVASGLSFRELSNKSEKIKELNSKSDNVELLCGIEVDILVDGSLDYSDEALSLADYVIGSVHVKTKMTYEQMTARMLTAINSGKIDILGHPTGRMFEIRESLDFDLDAVMKACADNNVAMEISGYTVRLDLNDALARKAKEFGCVFACGTDAHYVDNLESMKYAVWNAQRAFLTKKDIINCLDVESFKKFISERRQGILGD